MEIFIIAVAITLAFYCAYLSAALSSLSQEKLDALRDSQDNENIESENSNNVSDVLHNKSLLSTHNITRRIENKKYEKLHNLKLHYDESEESFFIVELMLYIAAFILLSIRLFLNEYAWYYILLFGILTFVLIAVIRSIAWALGSRFADRVAVKMTGSLSFLNFITAPFHNLLNKIIEGISGKEMEEASRDELNAMFETAHEEGSIETDEYRILKNIMHFSDVLVTDVMTPRTMLFSSHADLTVNDVVNLPEIQMYSRFPIWDGNSIDDGIVGYVISKDVLYAALKGKSTKKLREFSREVYIIPENASLDKALEQFLQRRQHLTIVVDEYGGVEGILTMEDVLETILGVEIVDEVDKIVDLREAAKHQRDKRIANFQSGRTE
ncbi:MAG: CNNM domain-containing protein [bacterium]